MCGERLKEERRRPANGRKCESSETKWRAEVRNGTRKDGDRKRKMPQSKAAAGKRSEMRNDAG